MNLSLHWLWKLCSSPSVTTNFIKQWPLAILRHDYILLFLASIFSQIKQSFTKKTSQVRKACLISIPLWCWWNSRNHVLLHQFHTLYLLSQCCCYSFLNWHTVCLFLCIWTVQNNKKQNTKSNSAQINFQDRRKWSKNLHKNLKIRHFDPNLSAFVCFSSQRLLRSRSWWQWWSDSMRPCFLSPKTCFPPLPQTRPKAKRTLPEALWAGSPQR